MTFARGVYGVLLLCLQQTKSEMQVEFYVSDNQEVGDGVRCDRALLTPTSLMQPDRTSPACTQVLVLSLNLSLL